VAIINLGSHDGREGGEGKTFFAFFAFFAREFLNGKRERRILAPALSGSSSRVIGARAPNSQRRPKAIWLPEQRQTRMIYLQRQAPAFDFTIMRTNRLAEENWFSPKLNVAFRC
jgi:hypothetical protein